MESCESPRPVPQNPPLEELLPSPDDHTQLHHNMVTLVTRTPAKHIPFIQENFGDVVVRHIPHTYTKEMSQKSDVVSLVQQYTVLSFTL